MISLYQLGPLGYAVVADDSPSQQLTTTKVIHIRCSLRVGLSSVPCRLRSRTQGNGATSLVTIKSMAEANEA